MDTRFWCRLLWFSLLAVSQTNAYKPNVSTKCTTPNIQLGQCIIIKKCDDLYSLLMKEPLTKYDEIFLQQSQCGETNGHPLVCCPLPVDQDEHIVRNTIDDDIDYGTMIKATKLPKPGECGVIAFSDRPVVGGFIVGGGKTRLNEAPWMALLQYYKPFGLRGFHCGGVMINQRYVLTASHCVNGKELRQLNWKLISVRLGEWDTNQDPDCEDGVCAHSVLNIGIENVIAHSNYKPNSKNQEYDIALIRLNRNIIYTNWIKPICLPVESRLRNMNYDGTAVQVLGWGFTSSARDAVPSNLKMKVSIKVVPQLKCSRLYDPFSIKITSNHLCAGGQLGFDSCKGDSGGPMMKYDEHSNPPKWYLIGIVSFGPSDCGQSKWPGIYTRVESFVEWINDNIKD